MNKLPNVLFLCGGNSCRSQMAEALFKHIRPQDAHVYSAGFEKHGLNPYMLEVLQEIGIDISELYSKSVEDLAQKEFQLVVTVCTWAKERIPKSLAKVALLHHHFDDPPALTRDVHNRVEALQVFRRVRDEIKDFITNNLVV